MEEVLSTSIPLLLRNINHLLQPGEGYSYIMLGSATRLRLCSELLLEYSCTVLFSVLL